MEEKRMENKPQLNKPTVLQQNNNPTEINLPGDHNTLIAHADNVKNEYRPTILITNPIPHSYQLEGPLSFFAPLYLFRKR